MKRKLVLLTIFLLALAGCAGRDPAAGAGTLVVTDGEQVKTYGPADLQALTVQEATFRDVAYVGVPLATLLQDAGFDPATITAVKARAADDFTANYDPALAGKPDTLVAYALQSGPLPAEDGTFRMVLPGQEGKLNVRQLVELTVLP